MMIETENFKGSRAAAVVEETDLVYQSLESAQAHWKSVTPYHCPEGCGSCCIDFEPDILECEALYLAAWLLHHHPLKAEALASALYVSPRPDVQRGCQFYDPVSSWHCTVYGGRPLVCRLFGYTGDRGKDGLIRWKPCKFLPLQSAGGTLLRRSQYSNDELLLLIGALPPAMCDITAQLSAIDPGGEGQRLPISAALPRSIHKIRMLQQYSWEPPEPNAPAPQAS